MNHFTPRNDPVDRLEAMHVFVAVAEAEGFAAGARRLGMSPPAVTRAISALEDRLGTRLFKRTTRSVRLTDAGKRYLVDCKRILFEIEDAESFAAGGDVEPRGLLRVTASVNFGRMFVAPLVFDFMGRHPRVQVRTLLVDHIVNLVDEGIDVAVRIAHLPDSTLRAVRVGAVRQVLCASPAYLEARGRPQRPADLARHDTIAFAGIPPHRLWSFVGDGDKAEIVHPEPRLFVNTADTAIAAAKAGKGLVRVLSYMIQPELRARQLELVLTDYEPAALPIHLVYPDARRATSSVRAFVELATGRLRALAQKGEFGTS
jgi:DNA-binding transcriptional LysR family regulator